MPMRSCRSYSQHGNGEIEPWGCVAPYPGVFVSFLRTVWAESSRKPWAGVVQVAAGNAPCRRAAVRVFSIRHAMVIGPVPPGIGVIQPAISATGA